MKRALSSRPLSGRVALVTGATRRQGIGAAICRELARAGATICFTVWPSYDRTMRWGVGNDEPIELREEIIATGVRCEIFTVDLSLPDTPRELLSDVTRSFGKPTILVNNAAYSTESDYLTIDPEVLDRHYAVNMRAPVLLASYFARSLEPDDHGRIVNITSGQSLGPMPNELAYALTKASLETLTRTLASELAERGATINTINPGPTDSGWISEELYKVLLPRFPSGRIGTPQDAARLVYFLVSPEGGWITGQVIHSEGGFRRS